MNTADHDTMAEASSDEDDDVFVNYYDEDGGPVPILAPLPREVLEWLHPGDTALVDRLCHMKLSNDAPYVGLRDSLLHESIVDGRYEPGFVDSMASATGGPPRLIDPAVTFTLRVRRTRVVLETDDGSAPVDNMKPGPWFRRAPKPEDEEQDGSAEPPIIIYGDTGSLIKLRQPGRNNYFQAIAAQQTDGKAALKIGHCPYEVEDNSEQDPFYLGPTVGWAPYFLNDMPNAGCFTPEKCLAGGTEQVQLPFIRCMYETDSPLALPYRGQLHDFLPIYRTRLRQGIPARCLGEASNDPVRPGLTLSEYTLLTGRYKDWTRLLIGLEMIRGQQHRGYYEAAATGLLTIVHFLGRHLDEFGLLPDSEQHNSGIRVCPAQKVAFWQRVHEMMDMVLYRQTASLDHIMNGRANMVPRKTCSAETPLAGQPFREPGMLPESWWIYGREVDEEWTEFFRDHFWGGSILESTVIVPVPAHYTGPVQLPQTATDTEEPTAGGGPEEEQDRQPYNIIARFTMENLMEVLSQLYWVFYGRPGEAPISGSNEFFSKNEYHYYYRMAMHCCEELQNIGPDRMPPSRYNSQKLLRYAGRKYRHPIEEFSV